MRDRDAERVAGETRDLLDKIAGVLPPVRRKLREWRSAGYPSGAGESSLGSDRHSDPTARAVQAAEILERAEPGSTKERRHIGWRPIDGEGDQLAKIDAQLTDLLTRARKLYLELAELNRLRDEPGEPGCQLCELVHLLMNATTGKAEHPCDKECSGRDHQHPQAHQRIYSRKAPKPPAPDLEPVDDRARCPFHYDFAERYGVDAHEEITRWHLDHLGDRIPHALLRQHHADELERHHATKRPA